MKKTVTKIVRNRSSKTGKMVTKKFAKENPDTTETETVIVLTEKEKLLVLLKQLQDLGINSIGDLEVKISRL